MGGVESAVGLLALTCCDDSEEEIDDEEEHPEVNLREEQGMIVVEGEEGTEVCENVRHRFRVIGLFGVIGIGLEESICEEVTEELVTSDGKMYTVFLCQMVLIPFLHGFETSHDFELVPDGSIGIIG